MPLTHRKRRFVAAIMAGMTDHEAAREAGYSAKGLKVAVFRLRRCPHVAAHLARARRFAHLPPREPTTDPLEFLQGIMTDPREPSALRFEAAAALLPYRHARLPAKRPAR
jgi:phage terminase small subunit